MAHTQAAYGILNNFVLLTMDIKNKLRNSLIRKIQQLSMDKLTEISNLLSKIENQFKSKDKTLKLAGSWKDLDKDVFNDLTEKLHDNRAKDRQIDQL